MRAVFNMAREKKKSDLLSSIQRQDPSGNGLKACWQGLKGLCVELCSRIQQAVTACSKLSEIHWSLWNHDYLKTLLISPPYMTSRIKRKHKNLEKPHKMGLVCSWFSYIHVMRLKFWSPSALPVNFLKSQSCKFLHPMSGFYFGEICCTCSYQT